MDLRFRGDDGLSEVLTFEQPYPLKVECTLALPIMVKYTP